MRVNAVEVLDLGAWITAPVAIVGGSGSEGSSLIYDIVCESSLLSNVSSSLGKLYFFVAGS